MAYRTSRGVNDLVLLDKITNEGILECLASHYAGDEIYVYIGQVLISVNPFKEISGLYSNSTCKKYPGKNEHQNAPHVFAIAERAYRGMVQDLTKECVIISGESGAGKTEASKKIMEYIAAVSSKSSDVARVKEQLLESNPLLEAFGNAKTLRNNNSSRFGKYMEIQFDIADPVGGRISVYLLEKNRVIERQQGERAFHIFYQLLAGASGEECKQYALGKPSEFQYLNNSQCDTVPEMNDAAEFKHTKQAMSIIGLSADVQRSVFRLLGAILHLGNIDFEKSGTGSTSNSQHMAIAASLLGISRDTLAMQLTSKKIKTTTETIVSPLSVDQAYYARDSLAKGIYGRLFQWLVDAANQSIHVEFFSNSIGVLDIYGFEIFGVNGFEQLCINYVNEKLHQLFIELTLKAEQDEYNKEGIQWQTIDYYNNLPIVQLIEQRGQIFSLLDEESIFPQGTDATLYAKLNDQLRGNNNYRPVEGKGGKGTAGAFVIRHYAGEVAYTTTGMLDKNKDLLFPNLIEMAMAADHELLPVLFQSDYARLKEDKKRPITSCVQFKNSVSTLMDTLSTCRQNYIRCIKPNEEKRPGRFDNDRVMDQIKYLGLLENVKVRRAGFAYRIPYSKFLAKYKACSKHHIEFKEQQSVSAEKLMKEFGLKDYELGRTKIFIRSPKTLFELEDMRTAFLNTCVSRIPKEDQLIYADKVVAYDKEKKGFHLFILTAQHLFLYLDKKPIHSISIADLGGISIGGEHADGFLVMHCEEKDKNGVVKHQYDVLVEDVYKAELLSVHEVLKSSGIEIDLRRTDNIPSHTDANFIPPKGTKAHKGKCLIM